MATKTQKEAAWNKAKRITGKNPNTHRKDAEGNVLYKAAYGKTSPMGWEVDHIFPKSRGGPDRDGNLQALNTSANRSKGSKLPSKKHKRQYRRKQSS